MKRPPPQREGGSVRTAKPVPAAPNASSSTNALPSKDARPLGFVGSGPTPRLLLLVLPSFHSWLSSKPFFGFYFPLFRTRIYIPAAETVQLARLKPGEGGGGARQAVGVDHWSHRCGVVCEGCGVVSHVQCLGHDDDLKLKMERAPVPSSLDPGREAKLQERLRAKERKRAERQRKEQVKEEERLGRLQRRESEGKGRQQRKQDKEEEKLA